MNEVVQRSKDLLQEKIHEFGDQRRLYDALQAENAQLNGYKRQVMMLEQEKRELETKVVTLTVEARSAPATVPTHVKEASPAPSTDTDPDLKGQVDFLNSVIVDMQRKNDELKAKIELFESAGIEGVAGNDAAERAFFFNGVSSRQQPPRLFCDICDEFDLHDTEDCPVQAQQEADEATHTRHSAAAAAISPAAAANATNGQPRRKVRPEPRPYCDTCEMFGHDTKDCDDEQTF